MTLLEEYYKSRDNEPTDPAKKILFAVMHDLLGRRGFRQEWDGFDDEIKEEILDTNINTVRFNIP